MERGISMQRKKHSNLFKSEDWRKEVDKRIDKLLKKNLQRYLSSSELYEITTLFETNRNLST